MTTEHDSQDQPASPVDCLVRRLRDGCITHPKRWSGDTRDDLGGAIREEATDALMTEAADEIERLSVNAETIEFARSASRLLYGFMLDCNSVGVHAAGENLARGLKHQMSVIAQREVDAANLTPNA